MEIIPYLIAAGMFVLVVYWSAANAMAKPGSPSFGLFRYWESTKASAANERKPKRAVFQPLHRETPDRPDTVAAPGRNGAVRPGSAQRFPQR